MKIGVLTSSRADYSIYYPLLRALERDRAISVDVIAFGTHTSKSHGHTIDQIQADGFRIAHALDTAPDGDSPAAIASSMAATIEAFTPIWERSAYDVVFCLGDRYEMFAACSSAVPFNIRLAHLHGGEETLGAIDNAFRHSITHMAYYHFAAAEAYKDRVIALTGTPGRVFNVGALSIENLKELDLLSISEFYEKFKIDLSIPSILITFHPETVSYDKNEMYVDELVKALRQVVNYQLVITMPNADTLGNMVRSKLKNFISEHLKAIGIESFGTIGYLTCMKYCSFMLGNTSSGFIEASYFPKYVINLGDRQKGRLQTENIVNCKIETMAILDAINRFPDVELLEPVTIYGDGKTSGKIVQIIKDLQHD